MHRVCGFCAQGVCGGVLGCVCVRGGAGGSSCIAMCVERALGVHVLHPNMVHAGSVWKGGVLRCSDGEGCVRGCIWGVFLQGLCVAGWVAVVGLWGSVGRHPLCGRSERARDAQGRSECIPVPREGVSVPVPLSIT